MLAEQVSEQRRFLGIAFDGFEKSIMPPLVLELVMVAILVAAHIQLGAA